MNVITRAPARLVAALVAFLLVAGGVALATPATAATGDVTAATLSWGVKTSFRNYILTGPAAGHWTVSGTVTDATPFGWTGGTGSASKAAATGSVSYTGGIHFQGHEGFGGIGAGNYALDLTISSVRVVQQSATAAQLVVDTYSNSLAAPTVFTTSSNVAFADVNLAGGTVTSTAATVGFSGAPATLTAAGATAFAGFYAAGTALDPVTFTWPTEQAPVPTITVSKSSNISPAGEIVTVTGTGFGPNGAATNAARPPLAGKFGGTYVAFGKYATVWQPSAGAASSTRKNGAVNWVLNAEDVATVGGAAAGGVAINADGSFSVQLLVKPGFSGEPATGNYGIFTYGGGGSNYAAFETYTPITFSTAPTVVVSQTAGLNPLGETLTVSGYNFGPNGTATNAARPPLTGKFGGAYVAFGKYADVWQPSLGAASATRKNGSVAWVLNAEDTATVGGTAAGAVAINADGTFSVTLTAARGFAGEPATGNYGIFTYGGGGSNYAAFETSTPVAFTAATGTTTTLTASPATGLTEGDSATLTAAVSPSAPGTVTFRSGTTVLGTVDAAVATTSISNLVAGAQDFSAEFVPTNPLLFTGSTGTLTITAANKVVGAGSLSWGVKQSFRSYVTGTIAQGSITGNGVGVSGGIFRFGQSTGGTFDPSTGLGTSAYSGSVRFYGHGGLLDVTLANPVVRIDSASQATLFVTVNGGAATPFATLNLAGGTKSTPSNTVSYSGVPASLTSQGAAVFSFNGSSFYSTGEPLDAVSFIIGSQSISGSGAITVAAFAGGNTADATPPATTGVTIPDGTDPSALTAGGEYSFEANGFGAGETGILAVIYSEPTVLASDLAADSAGVVRFTGHLPTGLTGEHTFTFQGSVDRGIVVTIVPKAETLALEGCAVTDGTLTWGFKESFRSYISGSIANGEWTVANSATYETPNFGFSDGIGTYDADAKSGLVSFTGSITFTGHGDILNTTVADPEIRFDSDDVAYVLLDVAGTTQDGAAIDEKDVEFVRLDLSTATVTTKDGLVTITGAPAELTAAGAEAFGTYESGEIFDPVTVSFDTGADCATTAITPTATPTAASVDLSWLFWAIPLLLIVIIAAIVLVVRRRQV